MGIQVQRSDLPVSVSAWMNTLGFVALRPDNGSMEIKSDNPDHGFQFPGQFELSAMGPANRGLEHELPRLLQAEGLDVVNERISWKHSSNGKYVSVRLVFKAETREQYDAAHRALRDHPEVKWTL
jgi:putative lipoic acid-binding regulatory protein